MSLEGFLLVGFDELKNDANLRRKGDSQPLITKMRNSIPKHWLQMYPKIAIISIVNLALDLCGMRWLLRL